MIDLFRADLHCHSTCSDGSLSPSEIVQLAKKIGLTALSITDHDTVSAYTTIAPLCAELEIELLTGVEFSCSLDGMSVHLLAYGIKTDNPEILNFCTKHIERRENRNLAILSLLEKHGMPLSKEELVSSSSHTIGRPHIALAMVKKGYVSSIQEAFRLYLAEGRPCYSHGSAFSLEETIEIIHKAKGIAVIAHPHLIKDQKILNALLDMPFDGIECYYGRFNADQHKRWLKIAKNKNWLITGGSDFHGSTKPMINLGCSWVDKNTFQAIKDKLKLASAE